MVSLKGTQVEKDPLLTFVHRGTWGYPSSYDQLKGILQECSMRSTTGPLAEGF
jgi:hypothetical protein